MRKNLLLLGILGMVVLVACGGTGNEPANNAEGTTFPAEVQTIRLPMGYIADPQYAPFYVAAEKGYFAEAGIAIEFDYSFETDGVALVGAGELPFAVVSGEQVLLARAQGLPVVYVMEWFQRFPIAIISKVDAGITTPEDLRGRDVGLPGLFGASYVGYVGLLTANNLTQEEVNASDIGFTQVDTLLQGQVDAVVGYANNEPIQLTSRGEAINILYVADYIDLVANGIITNDDTLTSQPELVQGFVTALLHGLADTLDNPDEAYVISQKYVEGLTDDSRKPVLEASLVMWQAETLGFTDPTSWVQTQDILLNMGLLDAPIDDLESAYTNQFIESNP
ncbi:MAG: ABC transporter substrate-binding protein [Chloroflexi bacterium]|nr:ABC transporter substrate-binding protein [Chloroflexota bacterium]MBP8056515.1 ABC transporter substrate-binding protein [Chloroflexota bacterium]